MAFDNPRIGSNIEPQQEAVEETKTPVAIEGLKFKDFEILKQLGEGSFGKVFQVRKRDTGAVYAMKSMSKKQLINNNQVRYAVTEAQIMKRLDPNPKWLKTL